MRLYTLIVLSLMVGVEVFRWAHSLLTRDQGAAGRFADLLFLCLTLATAYGLCAFLW